MAHDSTEHRVNIQHRNVLKAVATASAAGAAMNVAPYVFARTRTRVRVLGTHVTLQEALRVGQWRTSASIFNSNQG